VDEARLLGDPQHPAVVGERRHLDPRQPQLLEPEGADLADRAQAQPAAALVDPHPDAQRRALVLPLERVQQDLPEERVVLGIGDRKGDRAAVAKLALLRAQPLADVVLGRVVLEPEQPAELRIVVEG
jgi:hypothetical protein